MLSRSGFDVKADAVLEEAAFIDKIGSSRYDVIVADYSLPNWSGRDALRLRNQHWADIPFIFLTATQKGDDAAVECMREGATDYLLKDQLMRLPHAIRRAMRETQDALQQKRAKESLRRSEERYRFLFEHNPQPMWLYDPSSLHFLAVNQAAVDQYGYSREEFMSMTLKDIRPKEDVPILLDSMAAQALRAGVWRHRTKHGEIRHVEINDRQLDFAGQKTRLVQVNDLTERKRAIDELKTSWAKYRSIIEGAPYGICQMREDSEILMANSALARTLGYDSPAALVGHKAAALFYSEPGDHDLLTKQWRSNETISNLEVTWKRKDGKHIVVRLAGRALPVETLSTATYEIFVADVTEQRTLEQQFRQAQKMEAVGRLAGGVAHDFNNLLMIIGGCATLISENQADTAKVAKYTKQISEAASRAAAVTQQLLAFSRKQVLQPTVMNPNALVQKLSKMLLRLLGEDIELTVAPGALGRVKADPTQLEQVIMNLAVNARDAMPSGGKLIIETDDITLDSEYAMNHAVELAAGDYVMLAVSDTGIGMSPETRSRIFEPFFTTKEPDKGTGLGLATAFGIVKQSGGFIWVYSELGKGSTFKVYMPRVMEAEDGTEIAHPPEHSPSKGTETILLVEDEERLRMAIRDYLESLGYKVLDTSNGENALDIVRTRREDIDVLITDMVMPGMAGPQLAKEALALRPDLRVIYASGYTDRMVDWSMMGAHAVFLQKPFNLSKLAVTIRAILNERE